MSRGILFSVLVITFTHWIFSCENDPTPADTLDLCQTSAECPASMKCINGLCVSWPIACAFGVPCPAGLECVEGTCQYPQSNDGGLDGDQDDGPVDERIGPDIEVLSPELVGELYQIDFGTVMVGLPIQQQIVLTNVGDEDLQILNLNFETGTNIADFSIPKELIDSLPIHIAPDEKWILDVIYVATDGITDRAVLDIISNDLDESLVKIHLLSEFKGQAQAQLSNQDLDFGDVPVGLESQPLQFLLSNQGTGNAILLVEGIRFGLVGSKDYSMALSDVDQNPLGLPTLLNKGDFITVAVRFHPQQASLIQDQVLIVTDDALNPNMEVALKGRGVVGDLSVDRSPLDLSRVRVGTTQQAQVRLTNSGGAGLSLQSVFLQDSSLNWSLSSTDMDLSDLANNPKPLMPSEFFDLLITFTPDRIGDYTNRLFVDHTGPEQGLELAISAEAFIPPILSVDPDPAKLVFEEVQWDQASQAAQAKTISVLMSNIGGEPLEITDLQLAVADPAFSWELEADTILPQKEVNLFISFLPQTVGNRINRLIVDTNSADIAYDNLPGRLVVELEAHAIDPTLVVTPAIQMHDFRDVAIGHTVSMNVRLTSGNNDPLWITEIALRSGNQDDYSLANVPDLSHGLLAAGTGYEFQVQYHPTQVGQHYASLSVRSSDIGNALTQIEFVGKCSGCEIGFANCDELPDCETPIDTVTDCGGCDVQCVNQHGSAQCLAGECVPACDEGFADCNADPNDGCETDQLNSLQHCGSCERQCFSFHVADLVCSQGVCTSTCDAGFGNCSLPKAPAEDDGCETNLNTTADCGSCARQCEDQSVAALNCGQGLCNSTCLSGFANCILPQAPDVDDGCETHIALDLSSCGGCDRECAQDNVAEMICDQGLCQSTCTKGYGNCSQPGAPGFDDGCETHLYADTKNCGGCERLCASVNVEQLICNNGLCASSCLDGYGNCNMLDAPHSDDGCETNLAVDASACGACNRRCASNNVDSVSCSEGLCVSSCVQGYANCNLPVPPNSDDGCETFTKGDIDNCGGCDRPCANINTTEVSCASGVCNSQCEEGWHNCHLPQAPIADDGCETHTQVDSAACGGCNRPCLSAHVDQLACVAGLCTSTCLEGYGNCNLSQAPVVDDGCETYLAGDPNACGDCERTCQNTNVANLACQDGVCTSSCILGFANCHTPIAPEVDDGCETNVYADFHQLWWMR